MRIRNRSKRANRAGWRRRITRLFAGVLIIAAFNVPLSLTLYLASRMGTIMGKTLVFSAAAAGMGLLMTFLYRITRKNPFPPGHCQKCGYDLRETRYHCPECGDNWTMTG